MIYIVVSTVNSKEGLPGVGGNVYVGFDKEKAYSIANEKGENMKYYDTGIPYIDYIVEEWEPERETLPNKRYWACR